MKHLFYLIPLPLAILASGCSERSGIVSETYVHRYGMEVPKEEWEESGENGQIVRLHSDGVWETKTIANGMLNGVSTYTFPHSNSIERVQLFENGFLTQETLNFRSGGPMQETRFINPIQKEVTWWYESGMHRAREKYEHDALVQGEYFNYGQHPEGGVNLGRGDRPVRDPFGLLLHTEYIENGEVAAVSTHFANGSPKDVTPYVDGVIHGIRRTYYPGGEPHTVEEWDSGMQHGITTVYENGEKVAEVPYSNGKKEGIERRFRDGSALAEELTWHYDIQHGPAYSYFGDMRVSSWWYNGQQVNKALFDDSVKKDNRY